MTPENNNAELASLKNQVFILLVALVVLSGTLTVVLYRQVSIAGKDIAQAQQMAVALDKNQAMIGNFVGQMVSYGTKHSDFLPVLKKYGIVPNPQSAAPKM